jgi:hypothetical protein
MWRLTESRVLLGDVLPDTLRVCDESVLFHVEACLAQGSASDVEAKAPEPEGAAKPGAGDPCCSLLVSTLLTVLPHMFDVHDVV